MPVGNHEGARGNRAVSKQTVYEWKDGSGRSGRAWIAGINKLLEQGRRLTVQRVDRKPSKGAQAAKVAASQLDVREVPKDSNRGPMVQKYQQTTTVPGTGWPWCVAFVRWVWDRAGIHVDGYRGAYVPHLELWAKKAGKLKAKPVVGAAAIFDWNGDGVGDHTGIVETAKPLRFIEGNTQPGASGNQSDGGGVYRRSDRKPATIRGYVHP